MQSSRIYGYVIQTRRRTRNAVAVVLLCQHEEKQKLQTNILPENPLLLCPPGAKKEQQNICAQENMLLLHQHRYKKKQQTTGA
jgi:hypothetical protein